MFPAEVPRTNPVPETLTPEILTFWFPVLVTVSCDAPDDPTVTLPKLKLVALAVS
jgi:hypothetical protein